MKKQLLSVMLAGAMAASLSLPAYAKTKKSKIYLSRTKVTLSQGARYTLKIRGTKSKVRWLSSKKTVASVSSKGRVSAKKSGVANIYAKVNKRLYKCRVTISKPLISAKKATLYVGMKKNLKIYNNALKISWSSNHSDIASVNKNGQVLVKKSGTAKIKARVNKKNYYCTITVPAQKLSKSSLSLNAGASKKLSVLFNSAKVAWSSSDETIAQVDALGKVSGISAGSAVISASIGDVVLSCNVTVNDPAPKTAEAPQTDTPAADDAVSGSHTAVAASNTSTSSAATNDARSTRRTSYTNGIVGQTIKISNKIGSGSYSSSDPATAIVSTSGLVMPFKAGTVTISNVDTGDSIDIKITDPGNVRVGVDISYHNKSVDFNAMKKAGIQYAIIRGGNTLKKLSTTNSHGIDLNLKTNIDKAEAAGMDYGIYWYMNSSDNKGLMSVSEARAQANQLGATLQADVTDHFKLPIYLDLEETKALIHGSTTADRASYIQSLCQAFTDTLATYGFTNVGIYSSTSWYNNYLQNDYFVNNFASYWLAHYGYNSVGGTKVGHYTAVPSWKYKGQLYWPDIWQCGSDYHIAGVSGNVDMNYRYL